MAKVEFYICSSFLMRSFRFLFALFMSDDVGMDAVVAVVEVGVDVLVVGPELVEASEGFGFSFVISDSAPWNSLAHC